MPKNPDVDAVDAAAALCDAGHQTLSLWWVVARPSTLQKPSSSDWLTQEPAAHTLDSKAWMDTELVPLVAIPTTTGTGSETTQFAVIYRDNIKHSLVCEATPKPCVLVPKFTQAQPFPVRAAAGFDALSHNRVVLVRPWHHRIR